MLSSIIRSIERKLARRISDEGASPAPVGADSDFGLAKRELGPTSVQDELDPQWCRGKSSYIQRFVLEVSGECNLRCVYCPQAGESYVPTKALSEGMFEDVLEYLKRHPISEIDLTGTGDISMAPDWAGKSERLLALGIKLIVTMNMGRILQDHEVETLSKFTEITISLDTIDRKILNTIRKAVDVRTIVYNMMRIRAAERRNNTNVRWVISAVYTAEIAERLPELASFAVAFGANRFQIQDLIEFNEFGLVKKVTDVWTLTGTEAIAAVDATKSALDLALGNKLNIHIPPNFVERLDRLRESVSAKRNWSEMSQTSGAYFSSFNLSPEKGHTRDCIDPWTFVHVMSDGRIRPCCVSNLQIGKVQEEGGMEAALNSEVAVRLRKQLLTGELDELCTACSLRPVIDIASYRKKVHDLTAGQQLDGQSG